MTAEEARALAAARGLASAGRIVLSSHAELRMRERGATFADVRHALVSATTCYAQPDERWRMEGGCDVDGDALTLIVTFEADVIVGTLF